MKSIKLLDCTLRDGGYINNWNFGEKSIANTVEALEKSRIDFLEIGFLREEPTNTDRTVFRSIEDMEKIIPDKKENITYAAMAEAIRPVPAEAITPRNEKTVDAIRVIVWKDKHDENGNIVDALQDGYNYCKSFVEKGYELFVQPARVEQYSDEEFVEMINLFSPLKPRAIYIVDSWGTMYSDDVLHYMKLADEHMPQEISLGFHGHNNLMQAFANAVDFINYDTNRELILDSSVFGIGRGAGNLNTEIIAKYLNEKKGKKYDIKSFWEIYEGMIKPLQQQYIWGYTIPYFLSAYYHANPQYGTFYGQEEIDSIRMNRIMVSISEKDKVIFSEQKAKGYLDMYRNE